jgi:hypothetical protein
VKVPVADAIVMFSALAAIVVMVLRIVKQTCNQKKVDAERAKNHAKRGLHHKPGRIYPD